MSALDHSRTFAVQNMMSALHPKADMCAATRDVCYGPIADVLTIGPRIVSLEHVVQTKANNRPCKVEVFIVLKSTRWKRKWGLISDNSDAAEVVVLALYFSAPIIGEGVFNSAADRPARSSGGRAASVSGTHIRAVKSESATT